MPHRGARRSRRGLRRLRHDADRLQLLPQPALSEVPGTGPRSWLERARRELLPGALLPRRLHAAGAVAMSPSRTSAAVYDLLFEAAAETLLKLAAEPEAGSGPRSASSPSCTPGVRTSTHHPHVHCVVPGGGLSLDGARWMSAGGRFLPAGRVALAALPTPVSRTPEGCRQAGACFFAIWRLSRATRPSPLAPRHAVRRLGRLCQAAVRRTRAGAHLSRRATLTASPSRTAASSPSTNDHVAFRWKDYRQAGTTKVMKLKAGEFIRRFLLHALPDGFHRIRHFGFMANGHRAAKFALCRSPLADHGEQPASKNVEPAPELDPSEQCRRSCLSPLRWRDARHHPVHSQLRSYWRSHVIVPVRYLVSPSMPTCTTIIMHRFNPIVSIIVRRCRTCVVMAWDTNRSVGRSIIETALEARHVLNNSRRARIHSSLPARGQLIERHDLEQSP